MVHSPSAHTHRDADKPVVARRMMLLCSYCGGDRVQCSHDHPCADCLVMCNTYMIPAEAIDLQQYAGTLPGIVQGDKPLKKRLPNGWRKATTEPQAGLSGAEAEGGVRQNPYGKKA